MNDLVIALRKKRMEGSDSSSEPTETKPMDDMHKGPEHMFKEMNEKLDKILECVYKLEGKDTNQPKETSNGY